MTSTLNRMETLLQQMLGRSDGRAFFLRCYALMTKNMLEAVETGQFADPEWMRRFIDHFATYYFAGLDQYERDIANAPKVWVQAHDIAKRDSCAILQKVLLGINAHINFDLALTVADLLENEWAGLGEDQRAKRFADYCHVNEIIAGTIDEVQDQVIEPHSESMKWLDTVLGRVDEWLLSRLIRSWRDEIWDQALALLEAPNRESRFLITLDLEARALDRGESILIFKK